MAKNDDARVPEVIVSPSAEDTGGFGSASLLRQLQRAAHEFPRPLPEEIQRAALRELEVQPERACEFYYSLPFRKHTREGRCTG